MSFCGNFIRTFRWCPGQPSNPDKENCAVVSYRKLTCINDAVCDSKRFYVCEYIDTKKFLSDKNF